MSSSTVRPLEVPHNEKKTPAYKVFHWQFQVILPAAYAIPEQDIMTFGTLTTGNKKMDADYANEAVTTYRTIAELTKLYSEGCRITLVNPREDSPKIYDLVQLLLRDWADDFNKGFSVHRKTEEETKRMQSVIKDIELLEAFAEMMYPAAKRVMPAITKSSSLAAKLSQLSSFKLTLSRQGSTETAPAVDKAAPSPFNDNLTSAAKDRVRSWTNQS